MTWTTMTPEVSPLRTRLRTTWESGDYGVFASDDARKAFHDDLTALWTRNNIETDGTARVQAEYVEVIGTRA